MELIIFIFISVLLLVSSLVTISGKKIADNRYRGLKKLTKYGRFYVLLNIVILSLTIIQFILNNKKQEIKDNTLTSNILGSGYGIFEVNGSSTTGQYYCGLESVSKFPLYDITLMVTDMDSAIKCYTQYSGNNFMVDQDCFYFYSKNVKLSTTTLFPNMISWTDYTFQTTDKMKNLEIIFVSRNNHLLQQSAYKLQKGICQQSYRVYKFVDDEKMQLIKEKNDLNLPDAYWTKNFYPIEHRKLGLVNRNQ